MVQFSLHRKGGLFWILQKMHTGSSAEFSKLQGPQCQFAVVDLEIHPVLTPPLLTHPSGTGLPSKALSMVLKKVHSDVGFSKALSILSMALPIFFIQLSDLLPCKKSFGCAGFVGTKPSELDASTLASSTPISITVLAAIVWQTVTVVFQSDKLQCEK
eukprot:CAMPEP_0181307116 /NCGR_PEP_ID=MMETSP1101-20121128/10689_1 /TAXON_ID=46948 /ORGANISM="Rhodomonas abbreviata, Strain Caron Lab Isolate" /LENGTH=157 /DNA_ID=CAMNT_0023413273 /DNA_START=109 /DNA_END=579 /DNA_ORIENTATION=+